MSSVRCNLMPDGLASRCVRNLSPGPTSISPWTSKRALVPFESPNTPHFAFPSLHFICGGCSDSCLLPQYFFVRHRCFILLTAPSHIMAASQGSSLYLSASSRNPYVTVSSTSSRSLIVSQLPLISKSTGLVAIFSSTVHSGSLSTAFPRSGTATASGQGTPESQYYPFSSAIAFSNWDFCQSPGYQKYIAAILHRQW